MLCCPSLRASCLVGVCAVVAVTSFGLERPRTAVPDRFVAAAASEGRSHEPGGEAPTTPMRAEAAFGKVPLSFEVNSGQFDSRVRFLARGPGYTCFLTSTEAVIDLRHRTGSADRDPRSISAAVTPSAQGAVIRMTLAGANTNSSVTGLDQQPGRSNYYTGSLPHARHAQAVGRDVARDGRADAGLTRFEQVPMYARVRYKAVYPGVDLVYYGNQRQLEYDLIVAPGTDPGVIRLQFDGTDALEVDSQGELILKIPGGELRQHKPVIYQDVAGVRKPVAGGYALTGPRQASFVVGTYDHSKPLILDPVLSYATYLGGSAYDFAQGIAVDSAGSVYVTGQTQSTDFPLTDGTTVAASDDDLFITKLNSTGTALVYSTHYVFSGVYNIGNAIAVDAAGSAYVAGMGAGNYAMLLRLDPSGSALYGGLLGDGGNNEAKGIAIDGTGYAYLTGNGSPTFDVTPGAYQTTSGGGDDAFVAKLNTNVPVMESLVYSTFLGGALTDTGSKVAIDGVGNAYVTGSTFSQTFPVTAGGFQRTNGGGLSDAFVSKLSANGSTLLYSTYLGGSFYEAGWGIAVDTLGNIYVGGYVDGMGFPTTAGAFQPDWSYGNCSPPFYTAERCSDGFVAKFNPSLSGTASLVYSTYLGGSGHDAVNSLAIDAARNVYVAGKAYSPQLGNVNFPTLNPIPGFTYLNSDGFVAELNPSGTALVFSSYYQEVVYDFALRSGSLYLTGGTYLTDLIGTTGKYQPANRGGSREAFIAKIDGVGSSTPSSTLTAAPAALRFGAVKTAGSSTLTAATSAQTVLVTFSGASGSWTAATTQTWLSITGGSGSGAGTFTVALQNPGNVIGGSASLAGTITITSATASNSPLALPVTLTVDQTGGLTTQPPVGLVDSPAQNATGQVGAIGVTGWVVDDVGVKSVKIYRNCLTFEPALNCAVVNGVNLVYVGDATIVSGARPDIEAAYPTYPQANRAAWGYLLLTNLLPHVPNRLMFGGQGSLTLYVLAEDMEGHKRWLGRNFMPGTTSSTDEVPTTFGMANDTIAKPFGAIDTPKQGETVSGALWNFGWTLTPDSNTVADGSDILMPLNGSTQWVYIDGAAVAPIGAYNLCRGNVGSPPPASAYCNDDVSNIFGNPTPQATFTVRTSNPTKHRNLDAGRGPIAAFYLDTTTLANGVHTIVWGVTDTQGRGEGIGSRYFTVLNGSADAVPAGSALARDRSFDSRPDGTASASRSGVTAFVQDGTGSGIRRGGPPCPPESRGATTGGCPDTPTRQAADAALRDAPAVPRGDARALDILAPATGRVWGRTGFDPNAPYAELAADDADVRHVQMRDLGRLELWLGAVERGYLVANGTLRDLPPGSHLDVETGVFTWSPGLGYFGTYRLAFVHGGEQILVDVTIRPMPSADDGEMPMTVDAPRAGATVSGAITVAGWALDPQAWTGSGIDAVHVWAQRVDLAAAAPQFLGAAALGGVRPDVAQVYGPTFGAAGFSLTSDALAPGEYDITVFVRSRRTARWEDARTVAVTVR